MSIMHLVIVVGKAFSLEAIRAALRIFVRITAAWVAIRLLLALSGLPEVSGLADTRLADMTGGQFVALVMSASSAIALIVVIVSDRSER